MESIVVAFILATCSVPTPSGDELNTECLNHYLNCIIDSSKELTGKELSDKIEACKKEYSKLKK